MCRILLTTRSPLEVGGEKVESKGFKLQQIDSGSKHINPTPTIEGKKAETAVVSNQSYLPLRRPKLSSGVGADSRLVIPAACLCRATIQISTTSELATICTGRSPSLHHHGLRAAHRAWAVPSLRGRDQNPLALTRKPTVASPRVLARVERASITDVPHTYEDSAGAGPDGGKDVRMWGRGEEGRKMEGGGCAYLCNARTLRSGGGAPTCTVCSRWPACQRVGDAVDGAVLVILFRRALFREWLSVRVSVSGGGSERRSAHVIRMHLTSFCEDAPRVEWALSVGILERKEGGGDIVLVAHIAIKARVLSAELDSGVYWHLNDGLLNCLHCNDHFWRTTIWTPDISVVTDTWWDLDPRARVPLNAEPEPFVSANRRWISNLNTRSLQARFARGSNALEPRKIGYNFCGITPNVWVWWGAGCQQRYLGPRHRAVQYLLPDPQNMLNVCLHLPEKIYRPLRTKLPISSPVRGIYRAPG
ncbi:hypothetical protein B0H19DRAFT_1065721 [Mycena capillaripes]|nr:hypothetical protein B0H19DRAFT_1065721 [Mycena capillaripes]